jgi:hypothetical protein
MEGLDNPTSLDIPELTVLSSLPDTRNVPSDEKARDLTQSVCPERTDVEDSSDCIRIMMFTRLKPTAMRSFQYARAHGGHCQRKLCGNMSPIQLGAP